MLNVSSLVSRIQCLELNATWHPKLYTLNSKLLACKVNNFLSNNHTFSYFFRYRVKIKKHENKKYRLLYLLSILNFDFAKICRFDH